MSNVNDYIYLQSADQNDRVTMEAISTSME